jgi:hypothetical protein
MLTWRLGNRLGTLGWGLLAGSLVAAACSKGSESTPVTSTGVPGAGARMNFGKAGRGAGGGAGESAGEGGMAGSGDTTSTGGSSVTAGTGGSSMVMPGAPEVHVTSPPAVSDPNDTAVLIADELDVLCTATKAKDKGANDVDEATVLLEMLDANKKVIATSPGTKTDNTDEYTAHFITRKVPDNGRISFVCQASDTSSPALVGSDQIDTFIDHGPTIKPVDPPVGDAAAPPFATAVGQALHVAFKVVAAPVASGDKGATVGDVSLTVGGKPFDVTLSNGQYTATVHLDDSKIFNPIPDGDQKIVINASDQRKPKPASAELAYDFIVDGTGPDITIVSPQSGDIGSGKVQITFKVTDAQSGVDETATTAIVNQKPYAYDPNDPSWSFDQASGTYTFSFDTTQIENSVAQATLSVKAFDRVGNESDTKDVLLWLDNIPPIVDLDPWPVREQKISGTTTNCSLVFDPVGPEAANDLQVVHTFRTFRTVVWDESNQGTDQLFVHAATVDTNSVYLYLQPDPTQGLLKDTTGDGTCDALQTTDQITGHNLPSLQLLPVQSQGASFFGSADAEDPTMLAEYPMPSACTYGNSPTAPTKLCTQQQSDMTRVIHWSIYPDIPAIFAIPKIEGVTCTGDAWEIGAFVKEGWICAAVTAKDNVGNVGISRPLRLCYDDGVGDPPDCLNSQVPPPSCVVDGCSLPPRFDSQLLTP